MSDHDEILRLRDRQHDFDKALWGVTSLQGEHARGLGELRDDLRKLQQFTNDLGDEVAGMTRAEELAEAVAAALDRGRRNRFTLLQKTAAGVVTLLLTVPAVTQLAAWFSG